MPDRPQLFILIAAKFVLWCEKALEENLFDSIVTGKTWFCLNKEMLERNKFLRRISIRWNTQWNCIEWIHKWILVGSINWIPLGTVEPSKTNVYGTTKL